MSSTILSQPKLAVGVDAGHFQKTTRVIASSSTKIKKPNVTLFDFVKRNKLAVFGIAFLASSLVFELMPEHRQRPIILARNRLEQYPLRK